MLVCFLRESMRSENNPVIPAKAGIRINPLAPRKMARWIPFYNGMTVFGGGLIKVNNIHLCIM
jgi:hypothetical protein